VFFFDEEGASAVAGLPEVYSGAQAAVDYVNKNLGGAKGRPLQLTHCETLGTPDSVTSCANQAVSDKAPVVINGRETSGTAAVPILAGANIPYIYLNTGDPAALRDPNTFVLSSGDAPLLSQSVPYTIAQGHKRLGLIYTDVSGLAAGASVIAKVASKAGIAFTAVPVAATAADLTPAYSSLIAKNVDVIEVATSTPQCAAVLKARQALADSHPLMVGSPCISVLSSVPTSVDDGALVLTNDTSAIPTQPDTEIYAAALKTYEPSVSPTSLATYGFSSIMDLYNLLQQSSVPAGSFNASSIKTLLQASRPTPLFLAGGQTYNCGSHRFLSAPSICTSATFIEKYDSTTKGFALVTTSDMTSYLKGIY
jgi:branched-chain amino acid transport system substrate-binding protein